MQLNELEKAKAKRDAAQLAYGSAQVEKHARFPRREMPPKGTGGWLWMSHDVIRFASCGTIAPSMLSVYTMLCKHANNDTQECFPSHRLLAHESGMSRRTVIRALRQLKKCNVIVWNAQYRIRDGVAQRTVNKYKLLCPTVWRFENETAWRREFYRGQSTALETADGAIVETELNEYRKAQTALREAQDAQDALRDADVPY